MVIANATALTWTHSVSPSLHIPQSFSVRDARRFRTFCASDQSRKVPVSGFRENEMIVSITGATGFIGRRLVQRLSADNHIVQVLTRSRSRAELIFPVKDNPRLIVAEEPKWKDCIQMSKAVVNLAGLPISTRWSSEIRKEIKDSRIRVTSKVVDYINASPEENRPTVLVSATAIGYYGLFLIPFLLFFW